MSQATKGNKGDVRKQLRKLNKTVATLLALAYDSGFKESLIKP